MLCLDHHPIKKILREDSDSIKFGFQDAKHVQLNCSHPDEDPPLETDPAFTEYVNREAPQGIFPH